MIININGFAVDVLEQPTDIFGLKFRPEFKHNSNDEDWSVYTTGHGKEITLGNYEKVDTVSAAHMNHGVMEIGVCNNGNESFTTALLNNKPDSIPYLGIDIKDKTFLNDSKKKVYTIQTDSFNQAEVRAYAKSIKMKKISILLIDGWHSLNAVINDWHYVDMLSDDGIVIFHDTNSHPGPTTFLYAIDPKLFMVEKYFEQDADFGLSIAYRI